MHSRSWCTLHWAGTTTAKDSQLLAWNWQMNFRLFSLLLCVNIATFFKMIKGLLSERWSRYSAPVRLQRHVFIFVLRVLPHSSTQFLQSISCWLSDFFILFSLYLSGRGTLILASVLYEYFFVVDMTKTFLLLTTDYKGLSTDGYFKPNQCCCANV